MALGGLCLPDVPHHSIQAGKLSAEAEQEGLAWALQAPWCPRRCRAGSHLPIASASCPVPAPLLLARFWVAWPVHDAASRSLLDAAAMPVDVADDPTSLLCRVHGSKGRAQMDQQEERSATPEARQTRARKAQETAEADRQQQPRRTGRTSTAAKAEPGGSSSRGKPGHSSTQDEGSKEHSKEGPNGLPKLRKVKKVGLDPDGCLISPAHVPSPDEVGAQLVRSQQTGFQTA